MVLYFIQDQDGSSRPENFPTAPSSAEGTPTSPELVPLDSSLRAHPPEAALSDLSQSLHPETGPEDTGQLLMPTEAEDSGPGRPSVEGEATQMELSPAPTIS